MDDTSGGFLILFLSVMDFTDDHCLLLAAVPLQRNRMTTGGVVVFPFSPPLFL